MANKKVSELPAATALTSEEIFVINQGGTTKSVDARIASKILRRIADDKKFIWWGNNPDTREAFINARKYQQWPADGMILEVKYDDPKLGANTNGSWRIGGNYPIPWDLLSRPAVAATGYVTISGLPVANDTVTIDGQAYTWKASVGSTAFEVLIGADAAACIVNLAAAINLGSGSGTLYGSGTFPHPTVSASTGPAGSSNVVLTAKTSGTEGNAITLAESATNVTVSGSTLAGGVRPGALIDLQNTKWGRYQWNFLNVNLIQATTGTPARFDWFNNDEINSFVHNIRMFARLAKQGGCKGLMLDPETYNSSTRWKFASNAQKGTAILGKTFSQYQTRVKAVAKRVMNEILEEFNNPIIALAIGYEQLEEGNEASIPLLENKNYALYPSWLDGLYDAAAGQAVIVNACEAVYYSSGATYNSSTDASAITNYRGWQTDTTDVNKLGKYLGSKNYKRVHEVGMSIWIDAGSDIDHIPFNFDGTSNWATFTQMGAAMLARANSTDRFLFMFTKDPKPHNYTSSANKMPVGYGDTSVRIAKESLGVEVAFNATMLGTDSTKLKHWSNPFDAATQLNSTAIGSVAADAAVATFHNMVSGSTDHWTQGTGGKQPLYKPAGFGTGQPSLLFTAASSQCLEGNWLATLLNGEDKPYTILVASKSASNTPGTAMGVVGIGSTSDADPEILFNYNTASQHASNKISDSGGTANFAMASFATGTEFPGNTLQLLAYRSTGQALAFDISGKPVMAWRSQDVATLAAIDRARWGARFKNNAESLYFDGHMWLLAIYSEALDDAHLLQLFRYFGHLYKMEIV